MIRGLVPSDTWARDLCYEPPMVVTTVASANFLGCRCGHCEDVFVNLQSYIYLYSMDNLLARRLRRWGWGTGIATVVIVVVLALAGAYMID